MFRGRFVRWGLLFASLVAALLVTFFPTDEKRVRRAADALVDAANAGPAALARALDEHAVPGVSVSVEGLGQPLVGKSAILELARDVQQLGPHPVLRMDAVEVAVEGRRARLNAELSASQAEVPELRRPRPTVLWFEKRGEKFRLLSAEIGAERQDQPEARP